MRSLNSLAGIAGAILLAVACGGDDVLPPENEAPTANFTVPTCSIELACQFRSTSNDDVAVTEWSWDFDGDGSVDATTASAVFTYPSAGTFDVTLAVRDEQGLSGSKTAPISIAPLENFAPVADFEVPSCAVNAPCEFVSASTDDTLVTAWRWDFDGDGSTDATTATALFTYAAAGEYAVTLTALDAQGSSGSRTRSITLLNAAPVAEFTMPPCALGVPCEFRSTSTDDVAVTAWSWDFDGDGAADATTPVATFTFTGEGTFDVNLTVSDGQGATHGRTRPITFGLVSNTWRKRIQMPSDRRFVMTATVETPGGGSPLYAIGGQTLDAEDFGCSATLSDVEAYDGDDNRWTPRAAMPVPAAHGLVGVIEGRVYVTGGCRESFRTWAYDPATDQWTERMSAPMSLPSPVGSVVAGKMYVFDHCSSDWCLWDDPSLPLAERITFFGYYDPEADRWTRLPLPPLELQQPFAAATFQGRLYFLRGAGGVDVYTPETGTWTRAGPGPEGSRLITTAVVRSKWYVIGWKDPTGPFLSVYDPATDRWSSRAPPPADYVTDPSNRPRAGRVFADGVARLELVGGARPGNHWQYTP